MRERGCIRITYKGRVQGVGRVVGRKELTKGVGRPQTELR